MQKGIKTHTFLFHRGYAFHDPTAEMQKGIKTRKDKRELPCHLSSMTRPQKCKRGLRHSKNLSTAENLPTDDPTAEMQKGTSLRE